MPRLTAAKAAGTSRSAFRHELPLPGLSLDRVAECSGVLAHALIPRYDCHQLRRIIKQFCGCEMHRVEGANGLHWERPANAHQDGVCHGHDVATSREHLWRSHGCYFLSRCQASIDTGANDGSRRLCKCQCGSHTTTERTQ